MSWTVNYVIWNVWKFCQSITELARGAKWMNFVVVKMKNFVKLSTMNSPSRIRGALHCRVHVSLFVTGCNVECLFCENEKKLDYLFIFTSDVWLLCCTISVRMIQNKDFFCHEYFKSLKFRFLAMLLVLSWQTNMQKIHTLYTYTWKWKRFVFFQNIGLYLNSCAMFRAISSKKLIKYIIKYSKKPCVYYTLDNVNRNQNAKQICQLK